MEGSVIAHPVAGHCAGNFDDMRPTMAARRTVSPTIRLRSVTRKQRVTTQLDNECPIIYWHRDLPPPTVALMSEHTLEANSRRVSLRFAQRDKELGRCYGDLMAQARTQLAREVTRLGGDYAHVREQWICPRFDNVAGEAWLHGRFQYVIYREPDPAS
jgi:hypothetical protein